MARVSPSSLPLSYRLSVLAILLCGFGLAVMAYRDARHREEDRAEAEFERRVVLRHALTRETLGRYAESLFGLSSLFTVDANVSRGEFIRATSRLEERLPGVLVFEWVPLVPAERRRETEAALRQVYPGRAFQFIQFDAGGRPERAPERPFYYPICFVQPLPGNEIVLGYDLTTGPTRRFLDHARETRNLVVTGRIPLRQDPAGQLGIVMIWPVFRRSSDATTAADTFAGFLQCVFHVDELLRTASNVHTDPFIEALYVDDSEPDPGRRILYFQSAADSGRHADFHSVAEFTRAAPFVRQLSLPIGDRDWHVWYRPQAGWLETQRSSSAATRAAGVVGLSLLLAGLVAVVGRQTGTIKHEVAERTTELAESRRQFANLFHALPGMAFSGTWATTLNITFASEGTLALTGWSPSDFVEHKIRLRDLLHPEDAERTRREILGALQQHRDIELEFRIVGRTGEVKWVLSRGRGVYDDRGKLIGADGLIIDITDRKRAEADRLELERKLLESQKLESLGLLAGGIAHDFNNLLSSVLGNASLARMTLPTGNPADAQLRAIETAGLRAAELCRQMLAYAGKGRFVVENVNVSAIVDDLLPLLRVSVAQSAQLRLDLSREIPAVKADATQIRQIVMNLVLNAVDAMAGRSGEIVVRTGVTDVERETLARCVTGNNLPLGPYVFLEVSDTGTGMSPEIMSKIFDPFFTTKFSGRGLGLAAVLGIVRGHNGALLVESAVDRGTTFRLFLPALAGEMTRLAVEADAPAPEPWRQSGDVLVIEDEPPVREVMLQLLKTIGFEPFGVPDGRTGVNVFRENASRWTLVVIDLLMPGMSGEETLGALRAIKPDVRVLLMSGYAEGDVMSRVKGGGRVAFVAKPFKHDVFEQTLRDLFS